MSNEFRNLVFEGGGVKGIAYSGALAELEKMKILSKITRVAGTSAGAITAILISLGYSNDEITSILSKTNFNEFADDNFGIILDSIRLLRKYGWHKGSKFHKWIGSLIKKKSGNVDLTFKELHNMTQSKKFRDLYIVGTNLSNQTSEIYSYENTPNMKIKDAVRISMSIPLYYQAVFRKNSVLVDGGVIWNYPLNIFDNKKYLLNKKNGETVPYNKDPDYTFNHETLGFRLDSKDEISYNRVGWSNVPKNIKNVKNYAISLLNLILESANKRHLHKNDWNRTIFIDTLGVKTTDFDLKSNKIKDLIESGRKGVIDHFKWRIKSKNIKP